MHQDKLKVGYTKKFAENFAKIQEAGVMNIYICAKYPTFILPYADRWQKAGHSVVVSQRFDPFIAQKADLLFAEWMDENAVMIQNFKTKHIKHVKKILRLHRYEAYTEIYKYIKWDEWDEIVFVARHPAEYLKKITKIPFKYKVIRQGVEIDKYEYNPSDTKKIAFMGLYSRKKGLGELEILANTFRDYEFHLAGGWLEVDLQEKLEKNRNLHFHGWIDPKDKNDFFKDMKYIVSPAVSESGHIALMEGMLCGCKPLIRDWIGSDDIYKREWTWDSMQTFKKLLEGEYEPEKYREFIESNYDFERSYKEMTDLL